MRTQAQSVNREIHIALGFDSYYSIHIYPMLTSAFYNNRSSRLFFHAIAPGISQVEKSELERYVTSMNGNIRFYKIEEEVLRKNVELPDESYFTIATFYKWLFPTLIEQRIQKLLYLDPDIIVNGSLDELYSMDIGDAPIAAVADPGAEVRLDLGILKKEQYFNAGVMLLDLNNWRAQNITQKAFAFVKSYPGTLKYLDQDALNATLINNWYPIDKKYNFASFDVKLQIPVKQLIKDVVIVHFTSYNKPWNALTRNKLRYLYHDYLKLSPKSHEKRYTDFKWDIKNIWIFSRIRLKEFYFEKRINRVLPVKKWMVPSWDY